MGIRHKGDLTKYGKLHWRQVEFHEQRFIARVLMRLNFDGTFPPYR